MATSTTVRFQLLTQSPSLEQYGFTCCLAGEGFVLEQVINLSTQEEGFLYITHSGNVDWTIAEEATWVVSCFYTRENTPWGRTNPDEMGVVRQEDNILVCSLKDYYPEEEEVEAEIPPQQFQDACEAAAKIALSRGSSAAACIWSLMQAVSGEHQWGRWRRSIPFYVRYTYDNA